jgi:hypothetical protein
MLPKGSRLSPSALRPIRGALPAAAGVSRRGMLELLLFGAAAPCLVRAGALLAAPSAVRVTRMEPTVTYTEFDPDNPPAGMPPLGPEDAALCVSTQDIEVSLAFSMGWVTRKKAPIIVTGVDAITRLGIEIYTPFGDPWALVHEEAHREIAEHFYLNAADVARELGEQLIGRKFVGAGDTRDAALRNAQEMMSAEYTNAYLARAEATSEAANKKFDEITDHGRNDITEREAIELSIASVLS